MPLRPRPTYRPKTKGVTFRMTERDKARLEKLTSHYNVTITEALITLIDDAYEKTFPEEALKPDTLAQMLAMEERYPDA